MVLGPDPGLSSAVTGRPANSAPGLQGRWAAERNLAASGPVTRWALLQPSPRCPARLVGSLARCLDAVCCLCWSTPYLDLGPQSAPCTRIWRSGAP